MRSQFVHIIHNFKLFITFKAMVNMNKSRSGARGSRWYEQLKVVDDMNDIRSRAQASRYYEMLKAFIDLKDFES